MDGHRALKNEEVNRVDARDFQLVFSALADHERSYTFIIHASSNTIPLSGLVHANTAATRAKTFMATS